MRCGVFVMGSLGMTYDDVVGQAVLAEALGFESIFLGERHFRHSDLLLPAPLVMGAAIAAATSTIRIGTAARILPLDHPIHVAEDAATLDVLSDGRLDFGVTRASLDDEAHEVFGVPRDETEGRFEEALEVILLAWTRERFGYEGRYFSIPEVAVFPKPVQVPHPPIFVVAVSPERLAFAARHGYSVFVSGILAPDELAAAFGAHRAALDGRGQARARLVLNRFVYVSDSDEDARRELEGPFLAFIHEHAPDLRAVLERRYGAAISFERCTEDFLVAGSPETVAARLARLRDSIGVADLLATFNFVTVEHDRCLRSMELFADEVIPALRAPLATEARV